MYVCVFRFPQSNSTSGLKCYSGILKVCLQLQRNPRTISPFVDPAILSQHCIQYGPYEIRTSSMSHYPADFTRCV